MTANNAAKLWLFAMLGQQCSFFAYHRNSYLFHPIMLRSEKPLIMRDVFLVKSHSFFPNPLAALYVPTLWDLLANWTVAIVLTPTLITFYGPAFMTGLYTLGGFASAIVYLLTYKLFDVNEKRFFDVNATSNGAWTSLCVFSWGLFRATWLHIPLYYVTIPYVLRGLSYEIPSKSTSEVPLLSNTGTLGGLFVGIIALGLTHVTKQQRITANLIQRIHQSVKRNGIH